MTGAARRRLRRVPWALPAVVAVAAVTAAVVAVVCWWDWLRSVPESSDSGGETLRTLALILVAIAGLFFAWWRNRIAGRQAETANEQSETAARGLRNERYQKGADMLGNATLATRLGGIYALEQLAREHPEEYHVPIVDLLCAFIRHPVEEGRPESGGADGGGLDDPAHEAELRCAPHIEAAAQAIGRRRVENDRIGFVLNLRGAHLSRSNLDDAHLRNANLRGAILWNANLKGVNLSGANLSRTNLKGVKGLKQSGLDAAIIREGAPPWLEGALDAETGEPLVWQGEVLPSKDEAGD